VLYRRAVRHLYGGRWAARHVVPSLTGRRARDHRTSRTRRSVLAHRAGRDRQLRRVI